MPQDLKAKKRDEETFLSACKYQESCSLWVKLYITITKNYSLQLILLHQNSMESIMVTWWMYILNHGSEISY